MSMETGGSEYLDPMIAAEAAKFNAEQGTEKLSVEAAETALRELLERRQAVNPRNYDATEDMEDYQDSSDEELRGIISQLRKSAEFDDVQMAKAAHPEEQRQHGDHKELELQHAEALENYLRARRA